MHSLNGFYSYFTIRFWVCIGLLVCVGLLIVWIGLVYLLVLLLFGFWFDFDLALGWVWVVLCLCGWFDLFVCILIWCCGGLLLGFVGVLTFSCWRWWVSLCDFTCFTCLLLYVVVHISLFYGSLLICCCFGSCATGVLFITYVLLFKFVYFYLLYLRWLLVVIDT